MIKINTKIDRKSSFRWKTTNCNQHWKGNMTVRCNFCECKIFIFYFFNSFYYALKHENIHEKIYGAYVNFNYIVKSGGEMYVLT